MLLKIILWSALQLLFTAADSTTTVTHNYNIQHNIVSRITNDQLPLQQHSNKRQRNIQAWNQNNYGCNPGHCYVSRYQQWYVSLLCRVHYVCLLPSLKSTNINTNIVSLYYIQFSSNII